MENFIEQDCNFEFQGKSYTMPGASLIDGRLTAYLSVGGTLNDWKGNRLGSYKITSTWETPHSFISTTMNQVVALVDGVYYTGRSAGIGMVFNGKRKAKQSWY